VIEQQSHLMVRQLHLTNFRNYESLLLPLPGGVVALVGSNGQGKTNIAEALGYLSTLRSHRVATQAPLIRHGCDRAVIAAEVVRDDRSLTVDLEIIAGQANKGRINKVPVARAREVLGVLNTVTFAPEDLALVRGDPAERRLFLDTLATQRHSRIAGVISDYERVLKQRNALLKSTGRTHRGNDPNIASTLSVWDEQLVRFGSEIMLARADLIDQLRPLCARIYQELAPDSDALELNYVDTVGGNAINGTQEELETAFMLVLAEKRHQELDRGVSLVGPHRDDLRLMLGQAPVKGYASHGESWSVALAARLASYELLSRERATPVLILDDVFAELDARRRMLLAERVMSAPQVLITAAVDEDVPGDFVTSWFQVRQGEVVERG